MPLVRISLRHGKDAAYKKALVDGIYGAMTQAFGVKRPRSCNHKGIMKRGTMDPPTAEQTSTTNVEIV